MACIGQQMCRTVNYGHLDSFEMYFCTTFLTRRLDGHTIALCSVEKSKPNKVFSKNLLNELPLEALSSLPDDIVHACVNCCLQLYWMTLRICVLHNASHA